MYEPTSRLPLCFSNVSRKIFMGITGNTVPVVWRINFLLFIKCLPPWDRHYSITSNEQDYRYISIAEPSNLQKNKIMVLFKPLNWKVSFNNDCLPFKNQPGPSLLITERVRQEGTSEGHVIQTPWWKHDQLLKISTDGDFTTSWATTSSHSHSKKYLIWCSEYPVFQFVPTTSWKQDFFAPYSEWNTPRLWCCAPTER